MSDIAPAEVLDLMKLVGLEGLNETSIERHLQVSSRAARRRPRRDTGASRRQPTRPC
jgi:hypothetical protein